MGHSWQQVGVAIQSLDASNSDYLMTVKVPLNRYISGLEILEAGLRTSLGPGPGGPGLAPGPDPGPDPGLDLGQFLRPDPRYLRS